MLSLDRGSSSIWAQIVSLILLASPAAAQTTQFVDNIGDCAGLTPCHGTITSALAAAEPFATIQVFPSVYREALVFGAGKNNIMLQARTAALPPRIVAPTGATDTITVVGAGGVQLKNLIIEAPNGAGISVLGFAAASNMLIAGIEVDAQLGIQMVGCASSTIRDNRVIRGGLSMRLDTLSCQIERNVVEDGPIQIGSSDRSVDNNVVRGNTLRNGAIAFGNSRLRGNSVESNRVQGDIRMEGITVIADNVVRQNVVIGGGLVFGLVARDGGLAYNLIESNFISASAGDGIRVFSRVGGATMIRRNTSVDNAGCDINDATPAGNTWKNNRFATKCGTATE